MERENETGNAVPHHLRHPPHVREDRRSARHGCLRRYQGEGLNLRREDKRLRPAVFPEDFGTRYAVGELYRQAQAQEAGQPPGIPVVPADHLETGGRHLPEHEGERPQQPGKSLPEEIAPHEQDQVFPFALEVFAPSGLCGVILAGFVAAIMSATSALANAAGTIFSLDVYRRLLRPGADDQALIRAGRIASAAALILAALTTPLVPRLGGIFTYFQTGVTYMATPFVSVILLGILWKRTNYAAAMAGLLGGLVIQVGLALMLWAMSIDLNWLYVGSIAQVLTMALIVAVWFVRSAVRGVSTGKQRVPAS